MKATLLATAALALSVASASAETVLKLQTSTQSGAFEYTYISEEWGERLKAMSGGELSIEFFPINSIVDRKQRVKHKEGTCLCGGEYAKSKPHNKDYGEHKRPNTLLETGP